jgi:broad specificity phosphatase PhoE
MEKETTTTMTPLCGEYLRVYPNFLLEKEEKRSLALFAITDGGLTNGLCNTGLSVYPAGMRIILTRHYQTQSNAEGRILGWGNSPPCPDWKSDVDFIDSQLHENGINFDAIYSSDLERARQTAMKYAESFGKPDVTNISELREINYGKLQARKKSWVYEHYPQHKEAPDLVYPDGESFRQMQQRSVQFVSSLVLEHPERTVLIVSHAGVIRGIVSHFLDLNYAASLKHGIPFRYIGDFRFEGKNCVCYDELGKASGFVRDGAITIPLERAGCIPDGAAIE